MIGCDGECLSSIHTFFYNTTTTKTVVGTFVPTLLVPFAVSSPAVSSTSPSLGSLIGLITITTVVLVLALFGHLPSTIVALVFMSIITLFFFFILYLLPPARDLPKPTGQMLFKYVLPTLSPLASRFYRLPDHEKNQFHNTSDRIYADPELRSLVRRRHSLPLAHSLALALLGIHLLLLLPHLHHSSG